MRILNNPQALEHRFVCFARELTNVFPDFDLRFNLQDGTTKLRYLVADLSPEIFEADIASQKIDAVIGEAILNIKQIARLFDA